MFPTYGSEREDVWVELRCSWCTGNEADGDQPCCEDCEQVVETAKRLARVAGLFRAIAIAESLIAVYLAENVQDDHRIRAIRGQIADYDRRIHEASMLGMEVAS
jgi:hypothetical protein